MWLSTLHFFNDGFLAALPLMLPSIMNDIPLTMGMVGILGSILSFSGIVLAIPAGALSSRLGALKVLSIASLCYAGGFLLISSANGITMVFFAFLVSSLAFGVFHPVAFSAVAKGSKSGKLGKNLGGFAATGDMGRILFASLVTLMISLTSWRLTSFLYGAVSLVLFFLCFFLMRKKVVMAKQSSKKKSAKKLDYSLFKKKPYLLANLSSLLDSFANASLFIYIPFLLSFRGIEPAFLGIFTSIYFVGNLSGKVFMGNLSDKAGHERLFILSESCIFLSLVLLSFASNAILLAPIAYLLGFFSKGTVPITSAMVAKSVSKDEYESAYSLNSFSTSVANTISPLFFGVLSSLFGVQSVFLLAGAVALLSCVPAIFLRKAGMLENHSGKTLDLILADIACNSSRLDNYSWDAIDKALSNEIGKINDERLPDAVMSSSIRPAQHEKLALILPENYTPGTFFLSERLSQPSFISEKDNSPIYDWICSAVSNEVNRLRKAYPSIYELMKNKESNCKININDYVFDSLFMRLKNGKRLIEVVPNQIYQDVITKLISNFIYGDVNKYPYVEKDYNEKVEAISYAIADKIKGYPLFKLFSFSVSSGSLGVDMKSSASAASPIKRSLSNIIFYDAGFEETSTQREKRMFKQLSLMAARDFAINDWEDFSNDIVEAKQPVTLVWLHDDCAETIFDLLFIQELLSHNENVSVISIPRSGKHGIRFGNDASSMDFLRHLGMATFSKLKAFYEIKRYSFSEDGPCWGAVYPPHFSNEMVSILTKCDAVVVKGSRSYELMQNVGLNAYFASMVCREFSESIFDVEAESGLSIFVHQLPFLPSFQGFKKRGERTRIISGDKKLMLCTMTTKEYRQAIQSNQYKKIVSRFETQEEANKWIVKSANMKGLSIDKIIWDDNTL